MTIFAVVVSLAMIVAAGLVLDGGRLLAARRQAADLAGNAARAGAQEVDEHHLRRGEAVVDPVRASAAVARYLSGTPATGHARLEDGAVVVSVRLGVRPLLLRIAGVDTTSVVATRRARAVQGVVEET